MTKRCLLPCCVLAMLTISAGAQPIGQPLLGVPEAAKLGYSPAWSSGLDTDVHAGQSITSAVVLGDALALVEAPTNLVTAVALKDGSVRWRQAVGDPSDRIRGVTAAGKEWAICNDSRLYCVASDDGQIRRMIDLDCSASAMGVVVGNVAIIPGVTGRVFTEDLTTGNPLWAYKLRSAVSVPPLVTRAGVIAGDNSGNVVLINLDRGQMQWVNRTFAGLRTLPADNRQSVFIPSTDSSLYAWDLYTGQDQWAFHAGEPLTQSPLAAGSSVFLPLPGARKLVALQASTGKELWRIDAEVRAMIPVKAGLLLGLPHGLQVVDPQTGKTLLAADLNDALQYLLAGPGASVIVVSSQGRMMLLNPLP
jgi:outer membrane protein assembly factor BamB